MSAKGSQAFNLFSFLLPIHLSSITVKDSTDHFLLYFPQKGEKVEIISLSQ